ncbi:MAG: hypothetical protein QN178_17525 [Armatimonadota bacterium]|nr:hypothetical protein [Armatimonadota bacterium]
MRHIHTAVLERNGVFSEDFATEPYEAGWAEEAIFFVRVDAVEGAEPRLSGSVQISPDGIAWLDEGTSLPLVTSRGVTFTRVRHFGNWLRLACTVSGRDARFRGSILLCLKG